MFWNNIVFNDLDEMRRDMDALSEMFVPSGGYRSSFPRFNAYDSRDEIVLVAEVPGIKREKLDIRFENGNLVLSGERVIPVEAGPARRLLRQEREAGHFEKVFRIAAKIDQAGIKAKLENGILMVRVPKSEEAKPKQITIQA